jgi:uncharacterized protein YjeT (DUF2065 family)
MDKVKDIAIRAAKTAVQTFLAVATVQQVVGGDVDALRAAGIGALAAGFAVLWNAALAWASSE